ncbi:MAG TPA: hypothetical protein VGM03_22335, partial [Phycisphaerae bacterium]
GQTEYSVEPEILERYQRGGSVPGGSFDHGASFTGKVARRDVPERCGTCHADVARMNPYGLPADQLARYRTSGHGKALFERGDERVAVCIDCHGTHQVLKASDPRSPTNPHNVPATCGRCHADEQRMAAARLPTAVVSEYMASVHGVGLLGRHDTAMPNCATCHDNHAAAPPGFASVDVVCRRCHPTDDDHFLASPHAKYKTFPRCLACHGGEHGHAIRRVTRVPEDLVAAMMHEPARARPDDSLHPELSLLKDACAKCHEEPEDDAERAAAPVGISQRLFELIHNAESRFATTAARVDQVGRGVLLVQDERRLLADARSRLIQLAGVQHRLDPVEVDNVSRPLLETCTSIERELDRKERGLRWRRWGLLPMWGFILIFAGGLYVKHRRLRAQWVRR